MLIAKTVAEIKNFVKNEKISGKKIAFVPTMGALHDGHLSLIKKAGDLAEIVVVSIFVNKAQFNDSTDFEKYPRQLESDLAKLKQCKVDYVFAPQNDDIFPSDFAFKIIPTHLADSLCGATRPGHFDGVALIVAKLFNIVKPDVAIFGQKDFQQLKIIQKLVEDLNFEIEIFAHEIVREVSGLAMSSRNQRLSESAKIKAANIFRILSEIKKDPKILEKKRQEFLDLGFEKVDYLEIRDEKNLNLVTDFSHKNPARIFIAVYLDGLRLIDNMRL